MSIVLEAFNITKDFPGVRALDTVNFKLEENQIHALCGENGAGKSTLINVLSGFFPTGSFQGDIILEDKKVCFKTIKDALDSGIAVIHQELNLFSELSVTENLFIGNEIHKNGLIDWNEMYSQTEKWLDRLGLNDVGCRSKIGELGVGKQQLIEIAKVMRLSKIKVLILDEPTASLTTKDTLFLLDFLRKLKQSGTSCIYISHKIEEVMQIADYVTVLRDGKTVGGGAIRSLTKKDIIQMMVGREISSLYPMGDHTISEDCVLEIRNFSVKEYVTDKQIVEDANFMLKKGEILGLYGLVGAGRTELVSSIYGSTAWIKKGEVYLDGKKAHIKSPSDALKKGLAYLTEDRKSSGIIPTMSVRENVSISYLEKLSSFFGIQEDKEVVEVSRMVESLKVKTPGLNTKIINLSGGNQQKVLLARSLMNQIKVLIFDEPTRGIDVGAKQEIYNIIQSLAKDGVSVLMVSSELPEILGICDRVLVMNKGVITGEFDNLDKSVTQEMILKSATGTEYEVLL